MPVEPGSMRAALPQRLSGRESAAVEALLLANQALGVRLINNCDATSLRIENGEAVGVETSKAFLGASTIVIATGAWSSLISPLKPIRIVPVRGQMLCFATQTQIARHVIYSARGYLIPRSGGRLLAGSTTEEVGFDKAVTDPGLDAIKSLAFELAPALQSSPIVDSWAGLRPRAEDGLPVLGPAKEIGRLFYATGHYRNGILLAPITGELIAEAILSDTTPTSLTAFSPARFS